MPRFQPRPSHGSDPYVIAHRGISAKAPENTIAAFERAARVSGIDMVELDVRLSKDEEVIILHDRTLQRTSTGNGVARKYTCSEIRRFDAGSWFHPTFSNQHIPTLGEVLQLIGGQLWIDIEIKSGWYKREPSGLLEEKVFHAVQQSGLNDRVLFSSFDHRLLANLKRSHPAATTGVLYNIYRDFGRLPSTLAEDVGASVFVCGKRELTHRMVEDAHRHDIAVYVYTLNSVGDAEKMLGYGVDGIMSNNADEIIGVVKRNSAPK
jgi:glycerophosphoryl diester phosphodiesterase